MARGMPSAGRGRGGSSGTFTANFPGECWQCEERIERGDQVRYQDDDVVHADCYADQESVPRQPVTPCSKCFLVHAGECP